jgi:hypothetical protein
MDHPEIAKLRKILASKKEVIEQLKRENEELIK